jgi:hypothetical protein
VSEHRRLRFSDIQGIERSDLPFACDIWQDDVFRAPWATREVMKLAAYFVRYMSKPDSNALTLRELEGQIQMPQEEVRKTLVLMRNFNAVEGFLIERNDIRVGLKLTHMQRMRRFATLLAEPVTHNWPWTSAEDRWVPDQAIAPVVAVAHAAVPATPIAQPTDVLAPQASDLVPLAPAQLPPTFAAGCADLAVDVESVQRTMPTVDVNENLAV